MRSVSALGLCLIAVSAFKPEHKRKELKQTAPVRPLFPDIVEAKFDEFARGQAQCDGVTLGAKKCWKDSNGESFRFGCKAGDTRIFTDACDDNCGECSSQWTWGGEQQDTCYDDGQQLYHFTCEASASSHVSSVEPAAADHHDHHKSCADLGWPLHPGEMNVCGHSQVDNSECPTGPVDFKAAEKMCTDLGARLCTGVELMHDETKGTGCKGDCAAVWSSTSCDADGQAGHHTAAGANKCAKKFPETCVADDTTAIVRCCADVRGLDGATSPSVSYPQGFSPAISQEFKIEDRKCGKSEPRAEYSCWTDRKQDVSMRFACHDDDDFAYFQICGSDRTCNPDSCHGEWQKTGEFTNSCYNRASEGYLYQYKCPGKIGF